MSRLREAGHARVSRQLAGSRGLAELGSYYDSTQPEAMRLRMQSLRLDRVTVHTLAATRLIVERQAFGDDDTTCCFFVTRGAIDADVDDGGRRIVSVGSAFYASGASTLRLRFDSPCSMVVLVLPSTVPSRSGVETLQSSGGLTSRSSATAVTLALLESLITNAVEPSERAERHLARALEELAVGLFLQTPEFRRDDETFPADARGAALGLIDERFSSPELTPTLIARSLGVSVRHLQRSFQAASETVTEAIRDRRVREAVNLLTDAEADALSLPVIAARTGFGSVGGLRRAVATATGASPRALRAASVESSSADTVRR
ncbi:AraC family transcriptional regulator [Microbacteriaceae bacterium VKM Ac-2855]|nr:AraC family transcriptional regulator [Microbacteriaceae bacterium VKM Ac-2855]